MLATNRQLLHLEFPWTGGGCHYGERPCSCADPCLFIYSHAMMRDAIFTLSHFNECILNSICSFWPQLNLVVLVMTLHKMHSTAALKPDSSRHDNLR